MGAELGDAAGALNKAYTVEKFTHEMLALTHASRPYRKFHLEPATPEQVAEFKAWKKKWEKLTRKGWDNGWLETDYDSDTQPVSEAPRRHVYDETEEEFQERLAAWQAAQPKHVTFPVVSRPPTMTTVDPTEEGDREWRS